MPEVAEVVDESTVIVDALTDKEETQTPEPTEQDSHLASLAKKLGHKSKDEFEGPEGKWVAPEEFVARRFEILSERFDRASNKTKALEQMLEAVSAHVSKVEKVAYDRAIADLKQERRKAIEDGDADRVDEIDDEIAKVADDIRAEVPKKQEISDELQQWVTSNSTWFNKDAAMTAYASVVSEEYRRDNPSSTDSDMLAHVDNEVRQRFPEKFENQKRKTPPPVETGGSGGSGGSKGYSRNDLNEEQRKVHDYYTKSGTMTSADYIKSLIKIGELGGKK